jgi:hypothetical protein
VEVILSSKKMNEETKFQELKRVGILSQEKKKQLLADMNGDRPHTPHMGTIVTKNSNRETYSTLSDQVLNTKMLPPAEKRAKLTEWRPAPVLKTEDLPNKFKSCLVLDKAKWLDELHLDGELKVIMQKVKTLRKPPPIARFVVSNEKERHILFRVGFKHYEIVEGTPAALKEALRHLLSFEDAQTNNGVMNNT